ncbi:mycofactocin biosynthesis glycosyltransferase MftF [Phycicoccus sp. BSK3Z-2]|uniref:Mycofactocin biosynthesis glycosyltransferase MftF n=1 Tax=Phycicoccus avicenniae TaxID=2828860 RepID=A0A941D7H8_9MICO|nr:mycofactocin biosynthesis glycosyltransferase MftF [Phycicoccus avicenniae]MBR7743041.1 mycofactocin biosynthesis glycosyltransferase MftF [Phycicoccus avicenniae]
MSDARPSPDGLPLGFRVRLADDAHRCDDGRTLFGGSSGRLVHLRPAALARIDGSGSVRVEDRTSAAVARLLLDRGLAHPWWPDAADASPPADVTLVVPVLDRPAELDRLLTGLPGVRTVVVDDGSQDPAAVVAVCRTHDARYVRHPERRGPAAARNTGLAAVTTSCVAFADSDVVLDVRALVALRRHLDDPHVVLAAPRVLGLDEGRGVLARFEAARSSLDLGATPARVHPHGRVSYVPSAMLLARRDVLGDGFDESLEVAEDVDLVWRLAREHTVRYDPDVVVRHEHRTTPRAWLHRKAFYGTGAALLATRHGSAVAPVVMAPWAGVVAAALLAQRRWSLPVALAACAITEVSLARRLAGSDRPHRAAAAVMAVGLHATLTQTASALVRHHWPLAVALAPASRRARRALVVAAVVDGVLDHRRVRPDLDVVRWTALRRAEDLAYGVGLWAGCARERSARALLPLVRRTARTSPDPDTPPTRGSR